MAWSFDWMKGAFVGIDEAVRARCRVLGELAKVVSASDRLREQGALEASLELLACAANEAVTSVDRRVLLRRLGFGLHLLGLDDDARRIAGIALGRNLEPLGRARCAELITQAEALAFDAAAAELLPDLACAVEELRVTGDEAYGGAAHALVLRLCEDERFDLAMECALVELAEVTLAKSPWGEALSWSDVATVERARGRLTAAVHSMERACRSMAQAPGLEAAAAGWMWLRHATIASDAGRLREALASARKAVDAVDPRLQGDALLLLTHLCCDLGYASEGHAACARLLQAPAERASGPAFPPEMRHAAFAILCTEVIREGGAPALDATALLEAELDRLDEGNLHLPIPRPFGAPRRAQPASPDADVEDALARVDARLARARRLRLRHKMSEAALARARLLVDAARWNEAWDALALAARYARQANSFGDELQLELLHARASARRGEREQARERLALLLERMDAREDGVRWAGIQAAVAIEFVSNAFAMEDPEADEELRRVDKVFADRRLDLPRYELHRRLARQLLASGAWEDGADLSLRAVEAGLKACASRAPSPVASALAEVLREDAALSFVALLRAERPGLAANTFERARAAPLVSHAYVGLTTLDLERVARRLAPSGALLSLYAGEDGAPLGALVLGRHRECRVLQFEGALGADALSTLLAAPARALRLDGTVVAPRTTLEAELPAGGALCLVAQGALAQGPLGELARRFSLNVRAHLGARSQELHAGPEGRRA